MALPSLAHDVITKSRPANKGVNSDRAYKSSGRSAQKPNNKLATDLLLQELVADHLIQDQVQDFLQIEDRLRD